MTLNMSDGTPGRLGQLMMLDALISAPGATEQALVAMRAGRAPEAVQHLREVEHRGLDSYELHFYLGRAYFCASPDSNGSYIRAIVGTLAA